MTVRDMKKADVVLRDWNILQVQVPDGHYGELFLGYSVHDGVGRVSTRIESFDEISKTGKTLSGSSYALEGEPRRPHRDALYVLESKLGSERVKNVLENPDGNMGLRFRYPIK